MNSCTVRRRGWGFKPSRKGPHWVHPLSTHRSALDHWIGSQNVLSPGVSTTIQGRKPPVDVSGGVEWVRKN